MESAPSAGVDIAVNHPAEIAVARRAAKQIAEAAGLEPLAGDEIALAVSELASNLIKHANGGHLILTPLRDEGRAGLSVEAVDSGPGIENIERALTDGFSTAGGLGNGLGAARRLMDEFSVESSKERGTRIVCRKWRKTGLSYPNRCPLDIGVATRPKPGFEQNGDSYVVAHGDGYVLTGVIDGLGHGPDARHAALTARSFVESRPERPLEALFQGADHACRGTRGCVMALARFDWRQKAFSFASVGNIEARIVGAAPTPGLPLRRGIVGVNAPKVLVVRYAWTDSTLVLHSDGICSRWSWADFPELSGRPAAAIAEELLRRLAKPEDDATVLVVGGTAS